MGAIRQTMLIFFVLFSNYHKVLHDRRLEVGPNTDLIMKAQRVRKEANEAEKRKTELKYAADAEAAKKEKEKMDAYFQRQAAALKKLAEENQQRNNSVTLNQQQQWQNEIKQEANKSSCTVRKKVFFKLRHKLLRIKIFIKNMTPLEICFAT